MTTTHDLPAAHARPADDAAAPHAGAAAPHADAAAPGVGDPAAPADLATAPLSVLLREGTRADHEAAEGSRFVEDLLGGHLTVRAYADLALQLHAVYSALEEVGEAVRGTPEGAGLVADELLRVPALESDLAHLLGPAWRDEATVLPATAAYAARLRELAGADDGGPAVGEWLAHAYTRYLGDLSGGQVIGRMVQRHYGVADAGVSFYAFPAIPKPKPFKDAYRERMDALPLSPDRRDAVVEEARVAFRHNRALFVALAEVHRAG